MKLKTILTLLILNVWITVSAQFVTIPDPNFVTYLQNNYPNCMVGNQMDTTCTDIVNSTLVICENMSISNLEGIQYFNNLEGLHCGSNNLTTLPSLPSTLTHLDFWNNQIISIPNLPASLTSLYCSNNPNMTSIPALPAGLTEYYGSGNPLLPLPSFPGSLVTCAINDCGLTSFPILPNGLETLHIGNNPIGTILNLPPSLKILSCYNSNLTALPVLPTGLENLQCGWNNISSLPSLPQSLVNLNARSTLLSILPNLPDTMVSLNVRDCNFDSIPLLPLHISSTLDVRENSLVSLPALPTGIEYFYVNDNLLNTLPELPNTLVFLDAENNLIDCLPIIPENITSVYLAGNNFTCIPNYVQAMSIWPFLTSMPLCVFGDLVNNPNNCPTVQGIEGYVIDDTAGNCTNNIANVPRLSNVPVSLYDNNGLLIESTNSLVNGRYFFNATSGTYTVEIDTINKPYTVNCNFPGADSSFTLNSIDSLINNVNFPVECDSGFDIGTQSINTIGWVFPGQPHEMNIHAGDMSNWYGLACSDGVSGSITVTVIGPVTYTGPGINALTPVVSGSTYTYTITDFGNIDFHNDFILTFQTDTTAQLGDSICVDVQTTPVINDNSPVNNSYSYCYEVINSYDPNNKLVYPKTVLPLYEDWLTYTINFQNTGTAPAFNIRLEDTLSSLLDLSTFEVIGYKHANHFNLTGDKLIVYFPDIMLPDSTTNEPESKGYFQYRIKPISGLNDGTLIENTAHIFFDFNDPIVTNTAITSYVEPDHSSVTKLNPDMMIYPNPGRGIFYLKKEVELLNYEIIAHNMTGSEIDLEIIDLEDKLKIVVPEKGLIILTIKSDFGVFQKKLISQ